MKKNVNGSTLLTTSGSALIFALMVMFIILTAALGVASVSVIEQKNSSATGKSTQSFQVADSAVELVLKKAALDPVGTTLSSLGACTNGVGVVSLSDVPSGSAEVSFEDANGIPVTNCGSNLSQVAKVKAVATYNNTTRAVSTAVAAGTLVWNELSNSDIGNGWDNGFPPDYDYIGYTKDSRTGIVYLRGIAWHGTAQTNLNNGTGTLFTLPLEYRPAKRKAFFVMGANDAGEYKCRLDVLSNGEVGAYSPCRWISLEGVSFAVSN